MHTKAARTRRWCVWRPSWPRPPATWRRALAAAAKLVRVATGRGGPGGGRRTGGRPGRASLGPAGRRHSASLEVALAANPGHARLVEPAGRAARTQRAEQTLQAGHAAAGSGAATASDDGQRFERLSRAGALFVELGEGSSAVMALNDALTVRPNDQSTTLHALGRLCAWPGRCEDAASPAEAAHHRTQGQGFTRPWRRCTRSWPASRRSAGDVKSELARAQPGGGRRSQERRAGGAAGRSGGGRRRRRAARQGAAHDHHAPGQRARSAWRWPCSGRPSWRSARATTTAPSSSPSRRGMVAAKDDPAVGRGEGVHQQRGVASVRCPAAARLAA